MDLPRKVLLVTTQRGIRDTLGATLESEGVAIEHWCGVPANGGTDATVALCTPEVDWRGLLGACGGRFAVILSFGQGQAALWAEALAAGAFDAIEYEPGSRRVLETIARASDRWMRRESMREALARNPLAADLHER